MLKYTYIIALKNKMLVIFPETFSETFQKYGNVFGNVLKKFPIFDNCFFCNNN